MAAGVFDEMTSLLNGLAEVLESIAEVQGTPGEEDADDSAVIDGSVLPLIDGDTIVVGMTSLQFDLRSGQRIQLDVIPS